MEHLRNAMGAANEALQLEESEGAPARIGLGHNQPPHQDPQPAPAPAPTPPAQQHPTVKRAAEIHRQNRDLPTIRQEQEINEMQAEIANLIKKRGMYQSGAQAQLEEAEAEYKAQREKGEADLDDAITRRDDLLEQANIEIAMIRSTLDVDREAHQVRRGTIIRETDKQIAAIDQMIAGRQRFIGENQDDQTNS